MLSQSTGSGEVESDRAAVENDRPRPRCRTAETSKAGKNPAHVMSVNIPREDSHRGLALLHDLPRWLADLFQPVDRSPRFVSVPAALKRAGNDRRFE